MRRRLALLAVALVAVAGCGGGSHPAAHKRAGPTAAAAPASAPKRPCTEPGVRAQAIRFRTSDGVMLSGAVVGSGPIGAVLIHEYPRDYCGWLPYSGYLSRHGVRVLLFDLRCFGRSPCPGGRGHAIADVAAAMAELRRRGARRVSLVGASMGGAIAVVAAARLHPAAVVDLSGERDTTGLTPGIDANAGAAADGVTAPALFAVARGDRYVSPEDMRAVARRVRSATKRVIVLPAVAGHGWDLLFGVRTRWSPLAATVAAFIRRHAGGGPAPTPPRATAPDPLDHCEAAGPGWRPLEANGATGAPAARLGSGRVGVVFANDSINDPCSWIGEARALAAHGHAVAVFKASRGLEPDQAVTVGAALRDAGARRVVLVGASVGARAVLQAGAAHPRGVAGLVALSAERTVTNSPGDLLPDMRKVQVPVLSIGSRGDPLTKYGRDTRAIDRRLAHDRMLLVSGSAHGVELFSGRHAAQVRGAILRFLRSL